MSKLTQTSKERPYSSESNSLTGASGLLVTYGADFLKDDRYGLTPLFLSRNKGVEREEVFKYLLSEGAPYNETKTVDVAEAEAEIAAEMAQIAAAETARDEAASAAVGNTKAVVQANLAATSGDGSAITGDNAEVAAAAVAAGEATSTPADAAIEAAYGANITKEDRFGLPPMYLAKAMGTAGQEVFEYLLSEGAPYNETKVVEVAAAEEEIARTMERLKLEAEQTAAKRDGTLSSPTLFSSTSWTSHASCIRDKCT
ncbi:hypothetical protein R1sor_006309 [Riccia sorocarpa]|uniref:Ankyrin repeat protein n=1 Tax=Riccia sorocarpa TaxID=122646 RepID=A0ABD3HM18_9MARC